MAGRTARLTPDFTPFTPDHAGPVREFADLVARADGIEAFGEQTLFNLASPSVTHLLLTKPGAIVAYGQIDRHSAELAVHPQYRRNGIGGALLDAVKARDARAAVWAHGDLPGARALARSRSLNPTRELVYMSADLDPSARLPQVPAGMMLTTFTEADASDWLRVNAAAFADHPEQGRLTHADLQERISQPWFDPRVFWLARDDSGELLGYMWVKREPGADTAEIYVLGVSPTAQGRGVGKFLTEYALAHMATVGVTTMDLYVEGDNAPALATYTRYGFTRAITHVQYT